MIGTQRQWWGWLVMAFHRCSAVLPHALSIVAVGGISVFEKQSSHQSTSSDSLLPTCAPQLAMAVVDNSDAVSL